MNVFTMKPFLVFLASGLLAALVRADDAPTTPVGSPTPVSVSAGRYVLGGTETPFVLDTATGRVWQIARRGSGFALVPIHYEHVEGAVTPLPDYTPPPPEPEPQPDPGIEADRRAAAREFVSVTINQPIMNYAAQLGSFPPSLAALTANLGADERWQGPYLRATAIDPWGNRYRYAFPGQHNRDGYDVWSLGPDGIPSDDDIGNW